MFHSKHRVLVLSMVGLSWWPAIFADTASEPSALEGLLDAIVAIFVDDQDMGVAGPLGHEQEAGPSMPFIG